MMEVPSTPWRETSWPTEDANILAPAPADWTTLPGLVRHTFTHFHLELAVWAGRRGSDGGAGLGEHRWVPIDGLAGEALPSVMRKVAHHALTQLAER